MNRGFGRWPPDVQEVASRYAGGGFPMRGRWPPDMQEVTS